MNALQVNQTTELLSLVGHDLKKAGGYHVGACPFCGGVDRFTVKHTREGDRWFCRQCGDGKYHTAIDYIMRRDNCDFKTAYQTLTGKNPEPTQIVLPPRPKPEPKPITLPSHEWQTQALQLVDNASDLLLSDEGQAGQDYLTRRGLHRGTWYAWLLGFTFVYDPKAKRNRPAISMPWLDMDARGEVITAVKYRFIDIDPEGLRYIALAGSMPLLFGLWDVIESHNTLLLVEGEINALSLWQCLPRGVSVLSFGSEGGGRADVLQTIAKKYERVFIWCDDAARTKQYQAILARPCEKIQSLKIDGDKLDANRLLQKGELHNFINQVLGVECLGKMISKAIITRGNR
jgi:hypothetical protein